MTDRSPRNELATFLRGFGQVMLQPSAVTGALFLAGIAVGSLTMAAGGVLGALTGVITARLARWPDDEIAQGLYGFNGVLVGIGVPYFLGVTPLSLALLVLGSALSSLLMYAMLRWAGKLPPYTAPFLLATWLVLGIANLLGAPDVARGVATDLGHLAATLRGLAQVMFQDSWITGALFAAGILFHSRRAGAWALVGSAIGMLVAHLLGFSGELTAAGVYGFNGALTGIALGGGLKQSPVKPVIGIVLSTLMLRGFALTPVPGMTAPFVLATWGVTLAVRAGGRGRSGATVPEPDHPV